MAVGLMRMSMSQLNDEGVNDSIISLMECPVCYEYLVPPIHQCKNSHNVCSKCKAQLTKCPTCNEPFLNSRSVFAEQIAERLLYPCKNSDVGCNEKHNLKDIITHLQVCPHRMYECLLGRDDNCRWKGRSFDILGHMSEAHADSCWMVDENNVVYDMDIFAGVEDLQVVSAHHEAFWYNFKCDVQKKKLFLALQYIGPKELAQNFTYEFELCADADPERSITLKNRAHPDIEKPTDIYNSGTCVVLDFKTLKSYVDSNNNLTFVLRVHKALLKVHTDYNEN